MSCQLLVCPPLPHAICSKPAATLTGLSYVVRRKRTPAKFTGPSEVLIITLSHLSCVVPHPVCHVVRNPGKRRKGRRVVFPESSLVVVAFTVSVRASAGTLGLFIPAPPIIGPPIRSPPGTNAHPQVRLCVAARVESAPIHLVQTKLTAALRRG